MCLFEIVITIYKLIIFKLSNHHIFKLINFQIVLFMPNNSDAPDSCSRLSELLNVLLLHVFH